MLDCAGEVSLTCQSIETPCFLLPHFPPQWLCLDIFRTRTVVRIVDVPAQRLWVWTPNVRAPWARRPVPSMLHNDMYLRATEGPRGKQSGTAIRWCHPRDERSYSSRRQLPAQSDNTLQVNSVSRNQQTTTRHNNIDNWKAARVLNMRGPVPRRWEAVFCEIFNIFT